MDDWLLFLGAGASVGAPSCLPAFPALSAGVLQGMGWQRVEAGDGATRWVHPQYPSFAAPAMAPEVLFGTLQSFQVEFAREVAEVLSGARPNAVHRVAAAVLQQDGCVWTPNVDQAVEAACADLGFTPPVAGRAAARATHLLQPLRSAGPGTLVKFHGSVAAPDTLAFTDRELIAPLGDADARHLAELSRGRLVVLYGYAGADADLADLLDMVFREAARIVWFEPFVTRRKDIASAFPDAPLRFQPDVLPTAAGTAVAATATAFLDLAAGASAEVGARSTGELTAEQGLSGPPHLSLRRPPGITHARLVERFGAPGDEKGALRTARRYDASHLRVDALRGHLRWALGNSLYGGGAAAKIVTGLARHQRLLARLRPVRVRDYVITRRCALLLQQGDWEALGAFADWAVQERRDAAGSPNPSDLYYRAQARRYAFEPDLARQDAENAVSGLANAADPERLAGALYEAGSAALYQGRFADAGRYAFQLRYRRGRYAIPRWQAWGAWIEAITLCHQAKPTEAQKVLEHARERFTAEGRKGALADVRTASLLAARVALALGEPLDRSLLDDDADRLRRGRYRDDLDLLLADIAIAVGDLGQAHQRLGRVVRAPSCPVAERWARLGLAELARLDGQTAAAADTFVDLAADASRRGATWQQAQAVIGLALCQDARAGDAWALVKQALPGASKAREPADITVGPPDRPRVLWMLTI